MTKLSHQRRSIRLKGYDYTQSGAYFVTICTHERRLIFGNIVNSEMVINEWGNIVQEEWEQTAVVRPHIELDAFVVMPNHVHGILVLGATRRVAPTEGSSTLQSGSLGAIIGQFKSIVTKRINRLADPPDHPIWQRNYYEHIIRNETSLNEIRAYVAQNPEKWVQDSLFA